jgi:hypothetical protein
LLFLANFIGEAMVAFGIFRGRPWGWALGALVAGGAYALLMNPNRAYSPDCLEEENVLSPEEKMRLLSMVAILDKHRHHDQSYRKKYSDASQCGTLPSPRTRSAKKLPTWGEKLLLCTPYMIASAFPPWRFATPWHDA